MQYLSRGKYGTGEPFGAGWSEVRTNSGEGSLERWDSKVEVQGAAGVVRCWVVADMVRRRERRRRTGRGAMMFVLNGSMGRSRRIRVEQGLCEYCSLGENKESQEL